MTTFEDGPAKGQHLMLRRAARFLRVTEVAGKFDALDQPHDTPLSDEKLYAYEITAKPGMCHIRSGKQGASGFYPIASYRFCSVQPTDKQMRSVMLWSEWCQLQPKREDL